MILVWAACRWARGNALYVVGTCRSTKELSSHPVSASAQICPSWTTKHAQSVQTVIISIPLRFRHHALPYTLRLVLILDRCSNHLSRWFETTRVRLSQRRTSTCSGTRCHWMYHLAEVWATWGSLVLSFPLLLIRHSHNETRPSWNLFLLRNLSFWSVRVCSFLVLCTFHSFSPSSEYILQYTHLLASYSFVITVELQSSLFEPRPSEDSEDASSNITFLEDQTDLNSTCNLIWYSACV